MKIKIKQLLSLALFALAPIASNAAMVTLNSLERSITVGLNDTSSSNAAPGDGWYAGAGVAGTIRGRASTSTELRTQWFFAFDISVMAGISSAEITSVTVYIPQIGRLNNLSVAANNIKLYDPNFIWDTAGSDYPVFNSGRLAGSTPPGYPGGTILANPLGGYNDFGTSTDTSNPNVEGSFSITDGALLDTLKSWADDPANNEGFSMTYEGAENIGLAFGTPTLEITYTTVPEPSSGILLAVGAGLLLRRNRK